MFAGIQKNTPNYTAFESHKQRTFSGKLVRGKGDMNEQAPITRDVKKKFKTEIYEIFVLFTCATTNSRELLSLRNR